jgi:FMN phosphatase YigB (HAD superfamily)
MKNATRCSKNWSRDDWFSVIDLRATKGIIFDFDGTLFDNALIPFYLIAAWPPDMLRIWKERLTRKRFRGCDYSSPDDYYRAFFAALGKLCFRSPEHVRDWYFRRYMPRMTRMLKKHYRPRPGVQELFGLLGAPNPQPHVPRAAVYSDYPILKERMDALGLNPGPRIPLYGPESFGAQKPAVRPFLRIAEELGAVPEQVLVIGDREDTDGLGALNAGMKFFYLETGRRRYYRLDPYRRAPAKNKGPGIPSPQVYTGAWDELAEMLTALCKPL